MTYDGRQVSNFVLDICDQNGRSLTNLALQKVLYFCHVWSLVELGRPLIRHHFEAWQYGPVLQYVYHEFKIFDRSPIIARSKKTNPLNGQKEIVAYEFDVEVEALLKRVVNFYSRLSSSYLVDLSHADDGPWAKVWHHEGTVRPGMQIYDEDIKAYYSKANSEYAKFSNA